MADALERLGARHINAVIPWMGYSLQDKVFRPGEPIAAKVIANLVSNAHIKRVFLLDLHNSSTPGFFSIPSEHLTALSLFAEFVQNNVQGEYIVASPDFGGLKRARSFATLLGVPLTNIDKHRDLTTGEVTAVSVQGETVSGKTVVLFDDCIVSGGTVVECAKILKEQGANRVIFCATHGLFVGEAFAKLADPAIDQVVVTDSIAHAELPAKILQLPVAPLFSDAIRSWM
jgi:ribose-phosphate pyrophosphokinase